MGKLVRDNIPEIISQDDMTPVTRILDDNEYISMLEDKLQEEVDELIESSSLEEVADILEVLRAYIEARGSSYDEVEQMRIEKREERGGFEEKIYLEDVE